MAMADWENAGGGLVVRDMSNGQLRLIQMGDCNNPRRNCAFAELPVFSPDMKWIAYTWYNDELDGRGQLRIIANESGAKLRIIARSLEFDGIWTTAWSVDGKSILVNTRHHDLKAWQLAWVNVADGSLRVLRSLDWRIVNGTTSFSLSPDGRYIAYSALPTNPKGQVGPNSPEAAERRIYVLAADGSSEAEIVKTATSNEARWSADGGRLLFTSKVSGKTDLWSLDMQNGRPTGSPSMLQRDIGDIHPLGITRSGAYYYVRPKDGVEQISIAEFNPALQQRVVETFVGLNPSWSPDGKSLAFTRRTSTGRTFDQVIRSVASGEEAVYKHVDLRGGPPRWLHDGSGFLQLYLPPTMAATGRSWYLLDLKAERFSEAVAFRTVVSGIAALSKDDRTLYIAARQTNAAGVPTDVLVGVDLNTNKERVVYTFPTSGMDPITAITLKLDPAGDRLAMAFRDSNLGNVRLASIRTDGTDYRDLLTSYKALNVDDKIAWTHDGLSIVFAENEASPGRDWRTMRVAVDGGKPEFTGFTVKALGSFDLSPDGSRIAYSTLPTNNTQDLMVIENLASRLKESR